jgi:hypothetical protein
MANTGYGTGLHLDRLRSLLLKSQVILRQELGKSVEQPLRNGCPSRVYLISRAIHKSLYPRKNRAYGNGGDAQIRAFDRISPQVIDNYPRIR